MTNKERNLIKKKIIKCLTEDFKNNQAIFNKKEGSQVFSETDLDMVMDNVGGMNQFNLKEKFTEEFFKEFQFDAEFRNIFENLRRGFSPYAAIEHLCKSKKELLSSLQKAIENTPRKIIVTTERLEQLKNEK